MGNFFNCIRCAYDVSTPPSQPLNFSNYGRQHLQKEVELPVGSTFGGITYIGEEEDAMALKNRNKEQIDNNSEYYIMLRPPPGWVVGRYDEDSNNFTSRKVLYFCNKQGLPEFVFVISDSNTNMKGDNWIKGLDCTVGKDRYPCVDVKISSVLLSSTARNVFVNSRIEAEAREYII